MAEIYKGSERRKNPRLNERAPVLYRAAEDTSLDYISEVASSTTENISGGGICFEAEVYIPPDSTLEVQINKTVDKKLKAVLPIHANARVIWIKQVDTGKYKLGLQFVEISQHHRDEIRRNVEQKIKQERSE